MGVTGLATFDGDLRISDGSSNFATIDVSALAGDYTISIPTVIGNDEFCLRTTLNCTGAGTDEIITVAANNSSADAKAAADFVADGTSDETEINAALVAATGGVVHLLPGTFIVDGTILIPNDTRLEGEGNGTIVELDDIDIFDNMIEATGSNRTGQVVRDLKIDGRADLNTSGLNYGIYFSGVGSVGSRTGGVVENIVAQNFRGAAIHLNSSDNNTISNNMISGSTANSGFALTSSSGNIITNNIVRGSGSVGFQLQTSTDNTLSANTAEGNATQGFSVTSTSSNNTLTGNTAQGNGNYGFVLSLSSSNNTLTGNTAQGNAWSGFSVGNNSNNTVVGNAAFDNTEHGIFLSSTTGNTVSGNVVSGNAVSGIRLNAAHHNMISSNGIHNNGGVSTNDGVYAVNSDYNSIIGNNITDTSCDTTCYAINITSSFSDQNYLEGNRYSDTDADAGDDAVINDLGTGTIYAGQSTGVTSGTSVSNFTFRGSDSTTAFAVQNASGTSLLNVDTTNTNLTVAGANTTATLMNVTANSLTTGDGLNISSTSTGLTTGSLLRVSTGTTSAIATDGAILFTATGNYTSTSNVGLLSVQANATTAGTIQNIQGNALTTGQALYIASTSTGLTTGSLAYITSATTGAVATNGIVSLNATGNYTSTANAGLLDVKANSTAAGTVARIQGNALTTGQALYVSSTGTGLTTGSLGYFTSATTGAVATNGIFSLNATGAYTSTANAGLLDVKANSTATGTIARIQGNALTTGQALYLSSTSTTTTTGSLLYGTTATTGAVATNGIFSLNATGNYTSTSNAGLLDVKANSTVAGTIANFNGNALTTGVGVNIGSTGTGLTTGSLLRVTTATTGAVATNGVVSINATGNYTSTSNAGLLNVTANATTAGTVVNISGTALTTGTALNVTAGASATAINATGRLVVTGTGPDSLYGAAATINGTLNSSTNSQASLTVNADISPSASFNGTHTGILAIATTSSSNLNAGSNSGAYGFNGVAVYTGTGTIRAVGGGSVSAANTSTGTITNAYGFYVANAQNIGGGSITRSGGLVLRDQTAASTNVNLFIGDSSTFPGSGNWGIYSNSTYDNALAGSLRVGSTTAPTVALDVTGSALISGTLGVTGLTTLNGGLTVETGDTFTFNGDAFTDFTGGGLVNTGGVLTVDATTATGFFRNGGNSFAGTATLGTNDGNSLLLETNNITAITIDTSQNSTFGGNITFGELTGTRTLGVQTRTTGVAGTALTVQAGQGGAGAGFVGGALTLQGGTAGGTNASGGNINLVGGTGTGTGVKGLVVVDTATFSAATTQAFTGSANITQSNIDSFGSIRISANAAGYTATLTDPTNTTAGRLVYVSNVGTFDMTLSANAGIENITLKPNTSATMIWNGVDWTAAGASSATDLQAAYDNTSTSAGGAELILNAPGGNADGFTIRNNDVTPITGGLLEVQTSIGSNLFTVNNNATEFASNGGAETQGVSASTFPSSTWDTTTGGTVSRYTTTGSYVATGQASVSVVTTTTNHGARNRINASLTSGLTYTVSFAIRGTTSFSTLDVRYSPDGTTSGTALCATGQTVTYGQWTRITCSFVAGGSITSSNSILIRQTDATGRTFYIDNLSVNVNAGVTYAADGSVDNAGAFATNWSNYQPSGTATTAQETSVIYDSNGSARVTTSATSGIGMRNNLAVPPAQNTQYLVSFYARASVAMSGTLRVGFLPAGGTAAPSGDAACTDYSTQTLTTTEWIKVTCLFTTAGTSISNADLVIYQSDATARIIYVDALSVTLNTNNSNNVQIGGGNKGGPVTLFTLDRSSSAPIAANNDAYLGSMYYDTESGRIQCYEADGWGACGAAPDNIVNLNPEYAGAVLNGTGVGVMSADFCGNGAGLTINTDLCDSGEAKNYYKWTSPQASEQTYSIFVTYQLPATFAGFTNDDTVQLAARVDSTSNASVTYEMFKSVSGALTQCGTGETDVIVGDGTGSYGSTDTWYSYGINGNEATGCSFNSTSANGFIIFKINMKARSNASAYVGTLNFVTAGR